MLIGLIADPMLARIEALQAERAALIQERDAALASSKEAYRQMRLAEVKRDAEFAALSEQLTDMRREHNAMRAGPGREPVCAAWSKGSGGHRTYSWNCDAVPEWYDHDDNVWLCAKHGGAHSGGQHQPWLVELKAIIAHQKKDT